MTPETRLFPVTSGAFRECHVGGACGPTQDPAAGSGMGTAWPMFLPPMCTLTHKLSGEPLLLGEEGAAPQQCPRRAREKPRAGPGARGRTDPEGPLQGAIEWNHVTSKAAYTSVCAGGVRITWGAES